MKAAKIITVIVLICAFMIFKAIVINSNSDAKNLNWAQEVSSFMKGYRTSNDTLFVSTENSEVSFVKKNNQWTLPFLPIGAKRKALNKINEDQKWNLK